MCLQMRIREDATDDHEQSCSRNGLRKHVPSAGTPEQLAVLRLTPQANGVIGIAGQPVNR